MCAAVQSADERLRRLDAAAVANHITPRMRRRIVHTLAHITSHNPCRKLHVATFTFRHRKHTFPHSGQSQLCNPIPCFEPASATGRRGEHFHARQTIPCFEPASTTGRRIAPMIAHRVTGPAPQHGTECTCQQPSFVSPSFVSRPTHLEA